MILYTKMWANDSIFVENADIHFTKYQDKYYMYSNSSNELYEPIPELRLYKYLNDSSSFFNEKEEISHPITKEVFKGYINSVQPPKAYLLEDVYYLKSFNGKIAKFDLTKLNWWIDESIAFDESKAQELSYEEVIEESNRRQIEFLISQGLDIPSKNK